MSLINIAATILGAVELANDIKDVASQLIPSPPSNLTEKHRWYQATLKNETQFDLLFHESYFDSGRYWTAPGSVAPFLQMVFSGCNADGSILTGVSNGMSLMAILDNKNSFPIALGFTNPQSGSFKAGVIESSSAWDGYNAATGSGNSIDSANVYQGTDEKGNPVKIKFHVLASPGQEMTVVVTEVRQ